MTFAEAAMIMMSGDSANIQSLTVTQNGQYNAPGGVDGYNPVVVNVSASEPVIQSITITKNGTYTAPSGVDGYNPVIVNNPYETLWKEEHGDTEEIDTGLTDDDGDPIIIDGIPADMDDIDELLDIAMQDGDGDFTFTVTDGKNVISIRCEIIKSETQKPQLTVTNLKNGQSATGQHGEYSLDYVMYNPDLITNYYQVKFLSHWSAGAGYPYGSTCVVNLPDIGIDVFDWSNVTCFVGGVANL